MEKHIAIILPHRGPAYGLAYPSEAWMVTTETEQMLKNAGPGRWAAFCSGRGYDPEALLWDHVVEYLASTAADTYFGPWKDAPDWAPSYLPSMPDRPHVS